MKNLNIIILFGILSSGLMVCCQKTLLPDPLITQPDSTKTISIVADTGKLTVVLSTDTSANNIITGSNYIYYLKTFSPKSGDYDYFQLKANTSWKILSYPGWLVVNPMSG